MVSSQREGRGWINEVSTFSLRPRVILMLGTVVAAAVIAIVGFARLIAMALDQFEWGMYSLFIGLTLGGIPLIWRTLGRLTVCR